MNQYNKNLLRQQNERRKNNQSLVNAWMKLDQILQDTASDDENNQQSQYNTFNNNTNILPQSTQNQSKQQIEVLKSARSSQKNFFSQTRPQTGKPTNSQPKLRPLSGFNFQQSAQQRPISAISHISKNSSQPFFPGIDSAIYESYEQTQQNPQQGQFPQSKIATMKSLMNLRAASRPHNRPGTANTQVQQDDLKLLSAIPALELEDLIQKSEIIHSLQVDQILDLYTGKCLDTKVEYRPEQAVKFIDKIRKSCKKRTFTLTEQGLGLESANILAHILQDNNHFCRLNLEKNCLSDSGVGLIGDALTRNDTVIHLNLASNDIGTQGIVSLCSSLISNTSIVSLDISSREGLYRNRITQKAAEAIEFYLRRSFLMFLNISATNITREDLEFILIGSKDKHTLVQLDISHNNLGPLVTTDLCQHLQCTQIQDLNLKNTNIGDQGMLMLCEMLGHKCKNYRFQKLNLSENNITSNGISRLFNALEKNNFLQELYLDRNSFTTKSFQSITQMLWENNTIKILSLRYCHIEKEGGEYIGYGISKNTCLEELYLTRNRIRDYGLKIISDGLKENQTLKIIDLSQCKIGDQGGISLSGVLGLENSLKSINLWENNIHDYSGMLISESLRKNKNIVYFNVERNPISYKYSEEIQKSVQQNINEIKKQKVVKYVKEMHELKAFERQKYDIEINKVQLDSMQEMVEFQVLKEEEYLDNETEKEKYQTELKQKEYQMYQQEYKDTLKQLEELDEEIRNQKNDLDMDNKKLTREIGQTRKVIQDIKIAMEKQRSSHVIKIKKQKFQDLENTFKEVKSKAITATESHKSTVKNMQRLKEKIQKLESNEDSEEEREKLKKKQQEEQEQERLKQKQSQSRKNSKKKRSTKKSLGSVNRLSLKVQKKK